MVYKSLLLEKGGGIISSQNKSKQYAGAASLCIGIGGTGIATLSALKRKVYQQLLPDNPEEPYPRYEHIRFLAIDSDENTLSAFMEEQNAEQSEVFSLSDSQHVRALFGAGKDQIRSDPTLNWMEIDKLFPLKDDYFYGGIRQVGRYFLVKKAKELKDIIQTLCAKALNGLAGEQIDVYIFAGISGGTGGGCFIDTCYIIREALKAMGLDRTVNIHGFVFLPDIVLSKKEIGKKAAYINYNNNNGYAALKELDYYMSLGDADDWFKQNYGTFDISTQDPPVDMCYLLSATKANGDIVENAFSYSINTVSDYVMLLLSEVEQQEMSIRMYDYSPSIAWLVRHNLQKKHGANMIYHSIGSATAEIPMTQIATYLATGYYHRFQKQTGRLSNNGLAFIPKEEVDNWAKELGIEEFVLTGKVNQGKKTFLLPDIETPIMRKQPLPTEKSLPEVWCSPGQSWIDETRDLRDRNITALNKK